MKIAFPTQEDLGVNSAVFGHFGTAKTFVVLDTDSGVAAPVLNRDLNHQHGACQPLVALGGQTVDAVVVGGIGGGALRQLNLSGIRVYRAVAGSIAENYALFNAGQLPEFTMNQTCAGHQGIAGCHH
jgi:predicted Fe-Mo cluster-binding NifX family protein